MIEVTALTKRYGSLTVLDGVDFAVQAGEIAAVVGPSGAGKSTLARCINLLEKPTSGSILVDGKDLTRLSRRELRSARRAIGTVFQSASLLQRMTAAENVALPMRYLDISHSARVTRVHELLDRVGMLHRANHYPAQLSGGQQQRIGLARGLALKPSVLLADEPTSGLDPQTTASILKLLAELRDELRVAVVLITHEMDVVRNVADSVARLHEGKIIERPGRRGGALLGLGAGACVAATASGTGAAARVRGLAAALRAPRRRPGVAHLDRSRAGHRHRGAGGVDRDDRRWRLRRACDRAHRASAGERRGASGVRLARHPRHAG
jgi:ABC-type polar amino acid transport system ATPase subunit